MALEVQPGFIVLSFAAWTLTARLVFCAVLVQPGPHRMNRLRSGKVTGPRVLRHSSFPRRHDTSWTSVSCFAFSNMHTHIRYSSAE